MASAASLSGYVRSMTGVTFPDSISSVSGRRSSAFIETRKFLIFWPPDRNVTFPAIRRPALANQRLPKFPPLGMSVPVGASARRRSANEWFETLSKTRS